MSRNNIFDFSSFIEQTALRETSFNLSQPPLAKRSKKKTPPQTPMKGLKSVKKVKITRLQSTLPRFPVKLAWGNVLLLSEQYREYCKNNSTALLEITHFECATSSGKWVPISLLKNITLQVDYGHPFNVRHNLIPVSVGVDQQEIKLPGKLFAHLSPSPSSLGVMGLELWLLPNTEAISDKTNVDDLLPVDVARLVGHAIGSNELPLTLPKAVESKSEKVLIEPKPRNILDVSEKILITPKAWNILDVSEEEDGILIFFSSGSRRLLKPQALKHIGARLSVQATSYEQALSARPTKTELGLACKVTDNLLSVGMYSPPAKEKENLNSNISKEKSGQKTSTSSSFSSSRQLFN
jgi:hypothetical protein